MMTPLAYCWDENDYFTHSEPCTTDPLESASQKHTVYVLPANGCFDTPVFEDDKWPRRVNDAWANVESHVGEEGFVNGVPTKIEAHGPLPSGWSDTLPLPSIEEVKSATRMEINTRFDAALAGAVALSDPTPSIVAVEAALLAASDPEGLEYVRNALAARRDAMLTAVDEATTPEAVQAIVVAYAV